MNFLRQQGIVNPKLLKNRKITLVGAGAVGSFSALSLGKMGVQHIDSFDDDGVSEHNLPNQYYRKEDIRSFKVDALKAILASFSDATVTSINKRFVDQKLQETVIVATDSMASRRIVWEQFKRQKQTKHLIEARMGAELGMVYTISKKNGKVSKKDADLYEARLYADKDVKPLPCTARSIIYNVLMLAALVCRAYKGVVTKKPAPREMIFNMTALDGRSFMCTK